MRKVFCFIDGFNLYHAVAHLKKNHLKWLDLKKLAGRFIKPKSQILENIYYFSAYPTWRTESYHRHRIYINALASSGVIPVMGQFKSKDRKCPKCKYRWEGHEEKETDVNIAVAMLTAAYENRFAYLIFQAVFMEKTRFHTHTYAAAPTKDFYKLLNNNH